MPSHAFCHLAVEPEIPLIFHLELFHQMRAPSKQQINRLLVWDSSAETAHKLSYWPYQIFRLRVLPLVDLTCCFL